MEFKKKCPICNKDIIYKRKGDLQQAIKFETKCKQCSPKYKIKYGTLPKIFKRNCPKCNKELFYTNIKTKRRSDNRIEKICKVCKKIFIVTPYLKKKIYCCEKCYYEDDNILKGKFIPSFNKKACEYFDELNCKMGWNGVHGLNVGEKKIKKYWVDYYEPTLNLIIEWDEKSHLKNKEKDNQRQKEIMDYMDCKFYRIEQETLKIFKINKDGSIENKEKNYWFE